jgi:O-succinylbenzoic acid--CoA ligase
VVPPKYHQIVRTVVPVDVGTNPLALWDPLRRALDGSGPAVLPVDRQDDPGLTGVFDPGEDVPGDPTALVVATSGSTGKPKGVLLTAGALLASAAATHRRLGGRGTWLLATPPRFIGGIQVLVRSILAGTEPGVLEHTNGFRPEPFAAAARSVLATPGRHYTALVPTQLARLLDAGGAALEAACEFDGIVLGGAATPAALRRRAVEAGVRVVAAYGMSETASGCVYDGVPLDDVRVRTDPVGRIELSGPILARGYRRQPRLTAANFVDGWFRTSDLGRLDGHGRLEVLGRADDMINTGGVKVIAAEVERVLLDQPGVAQACVVGVPDQEWGELVGAAIVPDTAAAPDLDELRAAVRDALDAPAVPKRFHLLAQLPLRGPGKADRERIRALLSQSSPAR